MQELDIQYIDTISLKKDKDRLPVFRIILAQEKEHPFFNKEEPNHYIITAVSADLEDSEFCILTMSNIKNLEESFFLTIAIPFVQITHELSVDGYPSFVVTGDDDELLNNLAGPFNASDFSAIIYFPDKQMYSEFYESVELGIKEVKRISAATEAEVTVGEDLVNVARITIINLILGMMAGNEKSLVASYEYINRIEELYKKEKKRNFKADEDDKYLIVVRDILTNMEEATNPLTLSAIITQVDNGPGYVEEISDFENIIKSAGIDNVVQPNRNKKIKITSNSSTQDILAYLSAPITRNNLPGDMLFLGTALDLDLVFDLDWNSPIEDPTDVSKLNQGEFFTAMLIVVAIRLARLNEVYRVFKESRMAPIIYMITAISAGQEGFRWALTGALRLMAFNQEAMLRAILSVPVAENRPEQLLNGPFGIMLHNIAHLFTDEGWELKILREAVSKENFVLRFLEGVAAVNQVTKTVDKIMKSDISKPQDESDCLYFQLLPNMIDYLMDAKRAENDIIEMVNTLTTLAVGKNTTHKASTNEWKEEAARYYARFAKA